MAVCVCLCVCVCVQELPSSIGRLGMLTILNVDRNQLSDIPREVWRHSWWRHSHSLAPVRLPVCLTYWRDERPFDGCACNGTLVTTYWQSHVSVVEMSIRKPSSAPLQNHSLGGAAASIYPRHTAIGEGIIPACDRQTDRHNIYRTSI